MSEVKMPDSIREDLLELAETNLTWDGLDATLPDDYLEKTLPEGMTMETVKSVQDHVYDVVNHTAAAFGRQSLERFKENKEGQRTQLGFNVHKDSVAMGIRRTYEKPVGVPKTGEERKTETKHGKLDLNYTNRAGTARVGALKKTRAYIADLMEEGLA